MWYALSCLYESFRNKNGQVNNIINKRIHSQHRGGVDAWINLIVPLWATGEQTGKQTDMQPRGSRMI